MQTDRAEIGERLRLERKRMGLTQADLTDKIDAGRLSMIAFEVGRSTLRADQLAVLDRMGFDVLYIITGRRSPSHFAAGVNQ